MEEREDLLLRREKHKKEREEQVRRAWKKILVIVLGIAAAVAVIVLVISVISKNDEHFGMGGMPAAPLVPAETSSMTEETQDSEGADGAAAEEDGMLHIVAVGDNVVHEKVYSTADTSREVWNYDALYEYIREDIAAADLASVNEECILVADHKDVSGYPYFGAPTEIGDALVNAGFDVVTMATNHVYDKGVDGILQSVDYWNSSHGDTVVLGIHKDQEDAREIRTVELEGITIAMLNYTCLINGDRQDEIPTGMVDYANEVKMRADVQQARAIADLVIVYLHAGTEYDAEPDEEQISLLKMLLEEGVDIAICSHSHVLQGYETLQSSTGKQMLVYYSLGNLISTQKEPNCLLGGMADIKIVRDKETGGLTMQDCQLIPLVTHYNYEKNICTVYRLDEYTEELAAEHSVHTESDEEFTLSSLQSMADQAINASYNIWE